MNDVYMKRFDTSPTIEAVLQDGDGIATDLTGATVVFSMGADGIPISRKSSTIVSAKEGKVRHEWDMSGTSSRGNFDGEFEVTHPGGGVETFPRDGFIKVHIANRVSAFDGFADGVEFVFGGTQFLVDLNATFISDGISTEDFVFVNTTLFEILGVNAETFLIVRGFSSLATYTNLPYVIRASQ